VTPVRDERLRATYLLETPVTLEQAAEALAGEQSSGTFVRVPRETDELRDRFRARVESIEELEPASSPSLPGSRPDAMRYARGRVVVSWPSENVGSNLPVLLTTVAGNVSELRELSAARLLDIDVPTAMGKHYPGPRFGVSGTRRLTGVANGPIVGAIVKPSVGLDPAQTAALVSMLTDAGIEFVKDDELTANPPYSPLEARVAAVMEVVTRRADTDGTKVMFAFNVTGDLDQMRRHHDTVVAAGGTCVMVSINSVGLAGVRELTRYSEVPVHGHRNGWGMLTRSPALGMEFRAYQKLWRLAGVDHIHVSGFDSKFWEPNESVAESLAACREPLLGGEPIMPAISSGQWGGQAPKTYAAADGTDVIYLAGGGIMAHPLGPAAGVVAIRQAWKAASSGIDLNEFAAGAPELAESIRAFGERR
jgi:ribulose-bisphosphate carboxylase large chain